MREILFRGKRTYDGKWVYGWYCEQPFNRWPLTPCIIPSDMARKGEIRYVAVDPDTVGQYTGLDDVTGSKIFEGDVINAQWGSRSSAEVVFESGMFKAHGMSLITWIADPFYRCKIIGNIYDNPELMEGKNDLEWGRGNIRRHV
jgi:hypothetical protein